MAPDVPMINGSPPPPALKSPQKPSAEPNVLEVVFGSLLIKPWYPSFYPDELVGRKIERLYVCQWCFKYSNKLNPFLGHLVSLNCFSNYARNCKRLQADADLRKHVRYTIPRLQASMYIRKMATRYTKSTDRNISSTRRTSPSLRNFSSTQNPSSTMLPLFSTTYSSRIIPSQAYRIPILMKKLEQRPKRQAARL